MTDKQEFTVKKILSMLEDQPTGTGIPLGVSNRHIHLTEESMEILFGKGYELTKAKDLGQPGQFAAKETVCIAGKKGSFSSVRVLGPVRKQNQVEISRTDAFLLGVNPPVRLSGDLSGTADICVIGPKGMMVMKESVIVAKPHIHMSSADALFYHVNDGDTVSVEIPGERSYTMYGVVIRVTEQSALEFHIDTDEANAAGAPSDATVQIIK
ncbi:phosphate propanoyltransferase [Lacrimispora sp.]|uniref:phosphate propanoyltransferase n=1 Tax=Lacrimispora sp. TaxID=2719234 RepID=UPI0028A7CD29|nr:phosphate propanoyltransferase [Lacrimispora sp.]